MERSPEEERRDRFLGCMVGLAIGDALGAAAEGMKESQVAEAFGVLRDYHSTAYFRAGEFTDDASMALAMAEAIIARGEVDVDAIARSFLHWMETDGRGIGLLTFDALSLMKQGAAPLEAGRQAWELSGNRSAGNGAVMRCAPIALLHWRDQGSLIRDSITTSQITHYDPRCTWGCVAVNTAIAAIIRGEPDALEEARAAARGKDPELDDALASAATDDVREMRLDDWDMGYTILTTKVALVALKQFDSFEEGIVAVVNKGGDADTNGAVAGALLGARFGYSALPERWLDGLVERERVLAAAEGLFALAERRAS